MANEVSAFQADCTNAQDALPHDDISSTCSSINSSYKCRDNFRLLNWRHSSTNNSKGFVSESFKQQLKSNKNPEKSRRESTSACRPKKSTYYCNNEKVECNRKFSLFSAPFSSTSSIFSGITDFRDAQARRISVPLYRVSQSNMARRLSIFVSNVGDVVSQELMLGLLQTLFY